MFDHAASRRARRSAVTAALGLVAALGLTGCTFSSLRMSDVPTGHASHRAAVRTSAPVRPADRLVRGALADGSRRHRIDVGGRTLEIDYWTTRNAATWTASDATPVNISAHLRSGNRRDTVLVTRFAASWSTDGGTRARLLAGDRGRFVMTRPYSYSNVVVVPGVAAGVRSAQLSVQLDLLVETTPTSHQYARSTVLDQLNFRYPSTTATEVRS